ncbi:MAG TPA: ABC transporter ATP-binding protein [Ferruginibacter sp.]|nr:ABC transporter ATP-binding protein [Ferruginibacter sp.]
MKQLSALNKYFWKYKWLLLLGILFILLSNYFRILTPQFTGYILNKVVAMLRNTGATAGTNDNYNWIVIDVINWFNALSFAQSILFTGIMLILLALISGFFMFLMRQTLIVMSRHIEFDQKNDIYEHYQQMDAGFYKQHATGDLMNRISEDVSRVRMYTGPAIMYFINLIAVIGFSIFFMLKADTKLTMYALFPLPLLAFIIYFVNSIIDKKSEKIQSSLSNLTTDAQESFSGIRVIKSYVQEKAMLQFFTANSVQYKKNALSLAKTEAIYFPGIALLIGLSTLITIMVGTLDVVNNVNGATVGKIAEFVMYIQMLAFPVSAIGWTASITQRAAASQKRINEFLDFKTAIKDGAGAAPVSIKGNIHINDISFTYAQTGIKAIDHFSLTVKEGEKIAIVGRTGSGKSTLAHLLLRVYDVNKGSIQYEGTDVRDISLASLRTQAGYVPQEVFLFSDTIKNNIRFANAGASDEEVYQAARQASIFNDIASFHLKFETLVGERGVTLSGGQKQRISIARALLKKPELVILDDCLSAVDTATEKEILGNLYGYLQNRTAIIITHRIFSLFQFDKIIVMENGKIAETGNHKELMNLNGIYAEMYRNQQVKEDEKPANNVENLS